MKDFNNYDQNDTKSMNDDKINQIKKRSWKKPAFLAAVALVATLAGCQLKNWLFNQEDLDKDLDNVRPPVEDQFEKDVVDPNLRPPMGNNSIIPGLEFDKETVEEEEEVVIKVEAEEDLTKKDQNKGTTSSQGTESKPVDKNQGSNDNNGKPADTEKPSEINKHSHVYNVPVESYRSLLNGTHERIVSKSCVYGDDTKIASVLEDCNYVLLRYDSNYEYWECSKCEHIKKVKHVLNNGIDDNKGTVTYNCLNDGCDYYYTKSYTVTVPDYEDPDKDHDFDGGSQLPGGDNGNPGGNPGGDSGNPGGDGGNPGGPGGNPGGDGENPGGPGGNPGGDGGNPGGPGGNPGGDGENPGGPGGNPGGDEKPPAEQEPPREDETQGDGDGDGFIGGTDTDDDFEDEEEEEIYLEVEHTDTIKDLEKIREALLDAQVAQQQQVVFSEDVLYDYASNTLVLKK